VSAQQATADSQLGQAHTGSKAISGVSDNTLLLLIGGAVVLFHILTNGRYGFHRDELDILMNARHLDWGFISYPLFTPLVARIGLTLFGASLIGLRLFSALVAGLIAILVGLMARDFGAGRFGQVVAALAVAISPMALTAGMLIQYLSFDYLWWIFLCFCLVRLLRTEDLRWRLAIGHQSISCSLTLCKEIGQ
jgi:hypothetical protein